MAMQPQLQPQVQPHVQQQTHQPQQRIGPAPNISFSRKPGGVDLGEFEGGRLIVQGWDPSRGPTNLRGNLANRLPGLGLLLLEEMDEFIQAHGATVPPVPELPELYLVGVPDRDLFGAIGRILADQVLAPEIGRIEPDVVLSLSKPPAQLGTNFDLFAAGTSHTNYVADINASGAHSIGVTGKGVRIAVVDSGVDVGILTTSFTDLWQSTNTGYVDSVGHGTAMISIIQAVAPDAEIFAIRITDSGLVHLWDVMAGVKVATFDPAVEADIVNLSLGCHQVNRNCSVCGGQGDNRSIVFGSYLDTIRMLGRVPGNPDPVFVAAVGNDSQAHEFEWPARYTSTVAIGSVDHALQLSSFSHAATQKSEYCLCPGGEWNNLTAKATEWVGEGQSGGKPTHCVGTSAATAYASAILALYRQHFQNGLQQAGSSSALASVQLLDEAYNRCSQNISPNYDALLHGKGRLVFDPTPYQAPATSTGV